MKSLNKLFANKKTAILESLIQNGVEGTMKLYGVKTRTTFIKWVTTNIQIELTETIDDSPLAGMAGGQKSIWIRNHKDLIWSCLETFGEKWVIKHFHFTHDTLERHLKFSYDRYGRIYRRSDKLTRLERAELDAREAIGLAREAMRQVNLFLERVAIIHQDSRDTIRETKQLKQSFSSFTEQVSKQVLGRLGQALQAGLEKNISVADLFAEPDTELEIGNLPQPQQRPQLDPAQDTLLAKARELSREHKLTASYLQRKLRIGYPRATRILEQLNSEQEVSENDN